MSGNGMIGDIPFDKLLSSKREFEYPSKVKKIVNFFRFPKKEGVISSEVIIFGSYSLKIQPYYADFDTVNLVNINKKCKDTNKIVVKIIKDIIRKIRDKKGWFFTDMKAGMYPDGDAIHWRLEEILKGERDGKEDFNGHTGRKKLIDAVQEESLLKIDMVCPYYDKYIEATVVYLIDCKEGPFNYNKNYLSVPRILSSLVIDTQKQFNKGKYFKVVKRMFAIMRYVRNKKYINILEPLLASNLSKLSSINSDLSTLLLLLQLNKKVNINFVGSELQSFKEKLSNILDVNFNEMRLDEILMKIQLLIKSKNNKKAIKYLDVLIHELTKLINREIEEYFESKGYTFKNFVSGALMDSLKYLKHIK